MGIFNSVPAPLIKRSKHNLSFPNRFSAKFGKVYPVMSRKVIPGDRFKFQAQTFVQFQAMSTKVFQEFVCRQAFFFVPSRLLWDDFEDFYSVNETENYIHPYFDYRQIVQLGHAKHGSIFDYFNLPTFQYPDDYQYSEDWQTYAAQNWVDSDSRHRVWNIVHNNDPLIYHYDALKILAFVKIYADWYADENLQSELADWKVIHQDIQEAIQEGNGNITSYIINLAIDWDKGVYNKAYPKDYFTGALPFAQKGPQVNIPFTGTGGVTTWLTSGSYNVNGSFESVFTDPSFKSDAPDSNFPYLAAETLRSKTDNSTPAGIRRFVTFNNGLTSLENLRSAMMLQSFYERNARSGTRYKETILAHFGVLTPDARLDRSQFIQDNYTPVTLGSVYSTSANSDGSGITGEPVSTATGAGYSRRRKFKIDEHGYIISLWCCYPRASYYKGVEREWMELDKFDYFWPDFQHLGEQEVKIAELSLGNKQPERPEMQQDGETFGYNPRYSQYKVALPQIHGDFRFIRKAMSAARDIPYGVSLSKHFIQIDPSFNNLNRVFNYTEDDYDSIDVDVFIRILAHRPMSFFGIPRFFSQL